MALFGWDWNEMLKGLLVWAAQNPWQFIYYVLLCLSPLFLISAYLAWSLAKQIESKEKDKKKKSRREANMAKTRRHKTD
ncbi:small integral membrane protein 15-like [Gigantopelta aegis]|uniref:small integral membrane protein 15-like n=1 Tax=Gigantopelta aegis TaxID=1735272 RepID=UPI001B88B6F3|nr:small integral membrane protein 15-like [Gigantopelta aegis]